MAIFDSTYVRKLMVLVVALPLVFVLIGGWQLYRAGEPELHAAMASVDAAMAKIESISREHGEDVVIRSSDGKSGNITEYRARLAADKAALEKLALGESIQSGLAGTEMLLGLAGALTGLFGLRTIRRLGKKAVASRAALLHGFREGMKKLPWLVGSVGFFLAGALALGVGYEVLTFALSGSPGRGTTKLVVLGVLVVVALVVYAFRLVWKIFQSSRAVFESDPILIMGKSVRRDDAPVLWDFVASVAAKAGAAMPEGIVLGLDEGFFVTEHPVKLRSGAPVPSGRILYLPLPYMAFMERAEAAAVIGHELAHFTGADTEYSLSFSPIYAGAVNNLRAVHSAARDESGVMRLVAKPAFIMGEFFLDSFEHAVQHWSREREFEADSMGADVGGNEAVALSLLRISVLLPLVNRALEECWQKGGTMHGGVLARVRELARDEGLGDPMEHLEEAQAHPMDSHPAMRQRLEALGVSITPELLEKARCSRDSGLLRELGLESTVESAVLGDLSHAAPASGSAPAALSAALEREFSHAAKDNAENEFEELKECAAAHKEPVAFYEGGILLFVLWAFIALLGLVVCISATGAPTVRYGGLAFALGMAAFTIWRFRVRSVPFVVFTVAGLRFPGREKAVPWSAVEEYSIFVNSTNAVTTSVVTTLAVAEDYELPENSGDRRIRFNPEKRQIRIKILNLRGRMNAELFSERLNAYWQSGLARERLFALRCGK